MNLLSLSREHDLPPKWDGHPVKWEGWRDTAIIICPKVKDEPCSDCGSRVRNVMNSGTVTIALADHGVATIRKRRTMPFHYFRLFAFRCPDCMTDTVHNLDTDEWWTLDHTDYGPEGSRAD